MGKFGRREANENKLKAKLRQSLMGVVIFDHQQVSRNVEPFATSLSNAAVSLANWSLKEENLAIQDACTKLYEISCFMSSIIELFSKEYLVLGNSLKELLSQERDLRNLSKKVFQSEEKAAKLKKQNVDRGEKEKDKKKDDATKRLSFLENLGNAELEYEELKASFDAQTTKHEVLKAKCLRDAINQLANGTKIFAERLTTISRAQNELANGIPVVPTQITGGKEYQGYECSDRIVQQTADTLNMPRPLPFSAEENSQNVSMRKRYHISCFSPVPSSPIHEGWTLLEPPLSPDCAVNDPIWRNQQGRIDGQILSALKDRLGIDGTQGRSYISNRGIEQRQALKSRGLQSNVSNPRRPRPPAPPPRPPSKADELIDFPRVEPYAVSRRQPNENGLYARANLFVSSTERQAYRHSWSGDREWWTGEGLPEDNIGGSETDSSPTTSQSNQSSNCDNNEVVYAVLEREDEQASNNHSYVDVLH